MAEIWKSVCEKGYEHLYDVSNRGRIWSMRNRIILKPSWRRCRGRNTYHKVGLCRDYVTKNVSVHRLVTRAFLGLCPVGMEVDHKNDNKLDNHLRNLHYIPIPENRATRGNYKYNKKKCKIIIILSNNTQYSKMINNTKFSIVIITNNNYLNNKHNKIQSSLINYLI